MKTNKTILTVVAATIACSMTAFAEGEDKKKGKRPGPGPEARKEAMLKRFDKDKDGKLSEEEKAEAKKAMQARMKKHKEIRTAVLAKFDKNGNGKLDEDEREGVREWVRENYPNAKPPHGKRPGKKGPGPDGKKKKRGPGKKKAEKPEAEDDANN